MEKFSLLIHPFALQDFAVLLPQTKYVPKAILERAARFLPPFQVSVLKGIKSGLEPSRTEIEGELRCCPLTTKDFLSLPATVTRHKIISAIKSAKRNGAQIVGLGGWTSVAGEGESYIAQEVGIPVTTGNRYTIFVAIEALKEAAEKRGINWVRANLVILGAVGLNDGVSACARLLARENRYLTLAVREQANLDRVAAEILYETGVAVRITGNFKKALREADVVIAFTAAMDSFAEVDPGDLKQYAVVCDVFWPRYFAQKVVQKRKDVLVIKGGEVTVPGCPEFNFEGGFSSEKCPAWMAETMILAMERRYETSFLGERIDLRQLEEIGRLAHKHGFRLAVSRKDYQSVDNFFC